MAIWIGGSAIAAIGMDRSFELGQQHALEAVKRIKKMMIVWVAGAFATFISGMVLVFAGGGFSAMPMRIIVGIVLAVVIFLVGVAFTTPVLTRLDLHLTSNGDMPTATALLGRFHMLSR